MKEVDRKIRLNKVGKNRTEKIKVNVLIDTLKIGRDTSRNKEKQMSVFRRPWSNVVINFIYISHATI